MDDLGYDITDMVDIDPVIGDLKVFDRLLSLTHSRGLRMILRPGYGGPHLRPPLSGSSRG